MENPEVARALDEVADLLEIQGANTFRVRAYRNAARSVRDMTEPLREFVRSGDKRLDALPGIGADLAGKITNLVNTGKLPLLNELHQKVPAGLREIMTVPGLGPKRARTLYEKRGISSLEQLRDAARRHQIRELAGFGEKTETAILQNAESVQPDHRFYLSEAKVYANSLLRHLQDASGLRRLEVAGSYRRQKETVGDLDLLAICDDPSGVMDALKKFESVAEVVARGDTKMTVRLRTGLQIDLRAVPEQSYGAALVYFTGSKPHNIELRRIAQERGLKLNEYGVFRGNRRLAGRTEEEVYAAVGLPWIPPELREARGEIAIARTGKLPQLVKPGQIHGDLHTHTTATDGRNSLAEMVESAKARGYAYLAITDHSKRVTVAHGLNAQMLRRHWKAIEKLSKRVTGITLLKGVELDILEDGQLDLPDEVLAEADYVVASIHFGQNQPREKITSRMLNAIRNPYVHAIGHPTGRLIGQRAPYDLDLTAVLKAAAEFGCFMELNCQPSRLDLDDVSVRAAKELGVRIVLGSDAHAVEELGFMELGVGQARRGWLEAKDIANTRTLFQFRKLLKKPRRQVSTFA